MKDTTFENYLQDRHASIYQGLDDEMGEDYCAKTNGFVPHFWCSRFFPSDDILKFTQSEIEAAERRRTEEIIEFLKELGKEDEGDFWDMAYSGIANDIKDKFLTKPNDE
jgi:hypothetical protein